MSDKGTTDLRAWLDEWDKQTQHGGLGYINAYQLGRIRAALASTESERPALPTGLDLDAERRYLIDALTFRDGDRPHTVEDAAYRLDRYALNAAARDYLPVPVPPARSRKADR